MTQIPAGDRFPEPATEDLDVPASSGEWAVFEPPPEPWPTVRAGRPEPGHPLVPESRPAPAPVASAEVPRRRSILEGLADLAATVAHERHPDRPQPARPVSGGAIEAVGILGGLMSVLLVFACLAAGSVVGMVVFGVVLVCCVGLFLVGYQRDQRAE